MKAIINIFSHWGNSLSFTCPECLTRMDGDASCITHPTHHDSIMFGKGEKMDCINIGKKFKRPTIELEQV